MFRNFVCLPARHIVICSSTTYHRCILAVVVSGYWYCTAMSSVLLLMPSVPSCLGGGGGTRPPSHRCGFIYRLEVVGHVGISGKVSSYLCVPSALRLKPSALPLACTTSLWVPNIFFSCCSSGHHGLGARLGLGRRRAVFFRSFVWV